MDFRVFCVMAMTENGRKWSKKVHRGYLVGNGFSRIRRLFPTTDLVTLETGVN